MENLAELWTPSMKLIADKQTHFAEPPGQEVVGTGIPA